MVPSPPGTNPPLEGHIWCFESRSPLHRLGFQRFCRVAVLIAFRSSDIMVVVGLGLQPHKPHTININWRPRIPKPKSQAPSRERGERGGRTEEEWGSKEEEGWMREGARQGVLVRPAWLLHVWPHLPCQGCDCIVSLERNWLLPG